MDSQFYWDLIIELETRKQDLEPQLPNIAEEEFSEYVLIQEILGPLYLAVPTLQK